MTVKELIICLQKLPKEQQKLPVIFTYYDDPESSIPIVAVIDDTEYYQSCFPFRGECVCLIS